MGTDWSKTELGNRVFVPNLIFIFCFCFDAFEASLFLLVVLLNVGCSYVVFKPNHPVISDSKSQTSNKRISNKSGNQTEQG